MPYRSLGDEATATLCPTHLEMDMEKIMGNFYKVSGWRYAQNICVYAFAIIFIPVSLSDDSLHLYSMYFEGLKS